MLWAARRRARGHAVLSRGHRQRARRRLRVLRDHDGAAGGRRSPSTCISCKVCGIVWCFTGDARRPSEALEPLPAVQDARAPTSSGRSRCPRSTGMFDGLYPPGLQWYWKGDFFQKLTDEAIALHIEVQRAAADDALGDAPLSDRRRGRARRQDSDTRLGPPRRARFSQVIAGVDPDPAHDDRVSAWAKDYWMALHPHSSGGAYVNFMMDDEGDERVRATYGDNYERLASEAEVRSGEPVPGESEHRGRGIEHVAPDPRKARRCSRCMSLGIRERRDIVALACRSGIRERRDVVALHVARDPREAEISALHVAPDPRKARRCSPCMSPTETAKGDIVALACRPPRPRRATLPRERAAHARAQCDMQ